MQNEHVLRTLHVPLFVAEFRFRIRRIRVFVTGSVILGILILPSESKNMSKLDFY